ncbi:MAG: hypothetical protein A2179_02855 [Elusimicrobia bacterium GWC2_63_65]|nr:MAG: hypothetical protein A2179_02855 [Elusimicrobia bacterium GWC2_63_65]
MKKLVLLPAFLLALALAAAAGEFKDKGDTIAVDFPAGWNAGKSDDPAVTLKLEKNKSFFEFAKQDSELGDYYLKARVKEQVDSLRSRGNSLSGDVNQVSLHGVSTAYYTSYESMGSQVYIAFFTYNGASYAVSASGMAEGDFRGVMSSLRKPGEVIVLPKPKKIKVVKRRKTKEEKEEDDFAAGIFKDGEAEVAASSAAVEGSTVTLAELPVSTETVAAVEASSAAAVNAAEGFVAGLARKREEGLPPYLPRKSLSLLLWASVIGLWVAGSFAARSVASGYQNPKLPPPPAEVPPDFFFPFIISKIPTPKDVTYNILTRQKQFLLAEYPHEHALYLFGGVYGCLFFHVGWSLLAFMGKGDLPVNLLLAVPLLGRALASLPEIFFIIPAIMGAAMYFTKPRSLDLYDAQSTLMMQVTPFESYGLIRDGAGKEVARLVRKGGFFDRRWEFVDTDNLVVFQVRDDHPRSRLPRMLFGHLGGALTTHYGIFAQERRAGFVFLDPSSNNRFQLHMDYAFARLGHPAQILAAVLYIASRERDTVYPSF